MKIKINFPFIFRISAILVLALSTSCSGLNSNIPKDADSSGINFFVKKDVASTSSESPTGEYWNLETPPSLEEIKVAVKNDQVNHKVKDLGEWWLYGPGIGRTALNIGTVIVFPPYALYLLTNAGLSLAGYKPLSVLEALPEEPKAIAKNAYDSITQVPGRLNSLAAGKEYFDSNMEVQIPPEKAVRTP